MHIHNRLQVGYSLGTPLNLARIFIDNILLCEEVISEKVAYVDTTCVVQSCVAPVY